MIRAASPNCAVDGTSDLYSGSAAWLPSVSIMCAASSISSVETGQPRAPLDVQGNAESAVPLLNRISSSDTCSTMAASIGERSTMLRAADTNRRACLTFVATATVCRRSPGRTRSASCGRSRQSQSPTIAPIVVLPPRRPSAQACMRGPSSTAASSSR